jgi:hypothetical protein
MFIMTRKCLAWEPYSGTFSSKREVPEQKAYLERRSGCAPGMEPPGVLRVGGGT